MDNVSQCKGSSDQARFPSSRGESSLSCPLSVSLHVLCVVRVIVMYTWVMALRYIIIIWDRFRKKGPSAYYKNALCLNRHNFRTVNVIDFLFSALHSTPFLYVDLYFRVLHQFHADVMRPDYPWGSKLPHLQVGASNSFQILCVYRGVLSLFIFLVR